MATESPTGEALKKLSQYCCEECGAKELFLYCWKGCRHIQGIKSFYTDTAALRKQIETLQATVYAQELRFRDYEMQIKEKQQCLEYLAEHVVKLHASQGLQLSAVTGAPKWITVGVKMLWKTFADGASSNGQLSAQAIDSLKEHLRKTHKDVDEVFGQQIVDPLGLLPLYTRDGAARLKNDLKPLGILFGSSDDCAELVATNEARLDQLRGCIQELKKERDELQNTIDDSERAKTRLREAFASSATSIEEQARELQTIRDEHAGAARKVELANEKASECQMQSRRAIADLDTAKRAALDLRVLVDEQVAEKEKWQLYCWELEERLHDAVQTSRSKEHDLWRIRDSKKEEARKSMLLYLEAEKGKRHFPRQEVSPDHLQI